MQTKKRSASLAVMALLILIVGTFWIWHFLDAQDGDDSIDVHHEQSSIEAPVRKDVSRFTPQQTKPEVQAQEKQAPRAQTPQPSPRRGILFYRDTEEIRHGVALVPLEVMSKDGQSLLQFGQRVNTNQKGEFELPPGLAVPFVISASLVGFQTQEYEVVDVSSELISIEVFHSQRTWISVRMKRKDSEGFVEGPRLTMHFGSRYRTGKFFDLLSVQAFSNIEDVPLLLGSAALNGAKAKSQSGAAMPSIRPYTNPPVKPHHKAASIIGAVNLAPEARWLVLQWDGVPIQIAELREPNQIVEFIFDESEIIDMVPKPNR